VSAVQACDRLWRALERSAVAAGLTVTLAAQAARPWSSPTFTGGKHQLVLVADAGDGLSAWAGALDADAFELPGHMISELKASDIYTLAGRAELTIDAVTVERAWLPEKP
jgi:hypothetical protein